jgi:Asp-tRNA(Asn)/Glu-tRNA(Gln) amidotransferase B subunit
MGDESYVQYFTEATDEEIFQFFSVFTEKERKEDFVDMFGLINCVLTKRDGEDSVRKFFVYRDLIVKEVDTSSLDAALDKLIATNEKAWKEYIGGKDQAVGRFIGQLTKATGITPQDAKAFIESRKTK